MTTDDQPDDDLSDIEPWVLDEARAIVERGELAREKRRADRRPQPTDRPSGIPTARPVNTANR